MKCVCTTDLDNFCYILLLTVDSFHVHTYFESLPGRQALFFLYTMQRTNPLPGAISRLNASSPFKKIIE